jgi:hypothetical protein
MPAAVNVRADCKIGLLVRGLGRLALEDQNLAQSDQQRCNESEPSVTFHECLRGCRRWYYCMTVSMPGTMGIACAGHRISNEMFRAGSLSKPVALRRRDSGSLSNPRRVRG